MSSAKVTTGLLLFAKTEATYAAGATYAATDAVQVAQELPVFQQKYNYDGNRNGANWSGGNIQRTGPGGRFTEGTVKLEGKGIGSGSSYSLSIIPPNLHPFLLASGFSGSISGSGWSYVPVPLSATPNSLAMAVYGRGELLNVSGAYAAMKFGAEGAGLTMFEFALQGLCSDVSDVAAASIPSRTYSAASVLPPKNEGVALTIGSYGSAKVRNYSYEHGLSIVPRININEATGHSGFAIGRRGSTFTVTVEADALTNFDAWAAWRAGTTYDISMTVGSVAMNRFRVRFPYAQISNVEASSDDPVALWTLTFSPAVSGPDASDDVQLYWF